MRYSIAALYAAIIIIEGYSISGCQTMIEEPVITEQPNRLIASLEASFGPSYHIIMNGKNSVIYSRNPDGFSRMPGAKESEVPVTNEQWIEFRKDLNQADVWNWDKEYVNFAMVDGGSWMLDVEYPDRAIKARGNNAYPDEGYETFVEAIKKLVNGRDF